jgi:hypothetical protein
MFDGAARARQEPDILFDLWRRSQPQQQRLFISYRRGDTRWLAGRLSDSLAAYFGDRRVFRDVEGIEGGADFGDVIERTLADTGAQIVLIGRDWLDARDEQGRRRLDDPEDWVAREIIAALKGGVRLYPVLVEDTPMPRADELPAALRGLVRFNAVTLSDARWDADVARLARIVALDLPSATERRLQMLNALIVAALSLAVLATVLAWFGNMLGAGGTAATGLAALARDGGWIGGSDACKVQPAYALLPVWQAGAIFVVLVPASVLLFVAAREIDATRRRWFLAAAWTAALGSALAFVLYLPVCTEYESLVITAVGLVTAPLVLGLMSLSGFKPR